MNTSLFFALLFGFALGLKHAMEADHLVAVTTIVTEQRSVLRSAAVGLFWGIGHTASLLAAGGLLIFLNVQIPPAVARLLELLVALMIVFLGSRILYVLLRGKRRFHIHRHVHGDVTHMHVHFHDPSDGHTAPSSAAAAHHHSTGFTSWKSVIVGMIHGLAGSAALTLLVLTEVVRGGSRTLGLAYLLVFGLGSIGGMLSMSALISLPLVFSARRFERLARPMQFAVALLSITFGAFYAWRSF